MEYRLLGPLELWDGQHRLPIVGARQRAVLTFLLLHANKVVAADRLVDELWGDPAPRTAKASLRNQIAKLRKVLGHELLVTQGNGYSLRLEPGELDIQRFESIVQDAGACEAEDRAGKLREALSLWRGPALSDFSDEPFAQLEIARLEELRLAALESRIEADLALGHQAELVAELEALVARYPLRERLRSQLMLGLYRAGRQADALVAYQDARRMLQGEFGLEPTESLRQLERAILVQDRMLSLEQPDDDVSSPDVLEQVVSFAIGRKGKADLLTDLGIALFHAGRISSAETLFSRAIERAAEVGHASGEMRARLARSALHNVVGRETQAQLLDAAQKGIAAFERAGDEARISEAWVQIARVRRDTGGSLRASTRAYERALAHARRAGDRDGEHRILSAIAQNLTYGPCPALKAIERCEQIRELVRDDAFASAQVTQCLALLHAMRGRFDEGRLLCAQSRQTFDQLGLRLHSARVSFSSGPLELLAGHPDAAEAELRASYEVLDSIGERGTSMAVACFLARSLHDQGRHREADKYGRVVQQLAAEDDLAAQILWRTARAAALASLGSLERAELFAQEAIALTEPTDWYVWGAHITLAHVLAAARRYEDASTAAQKALAREKRKGNVVAAKAARALLSDLAPRSTRVAHRRSGTPAA